MSDTNPNAYFAEAQELRTQGQNLLNQADGLEAKGRELQTDAPDAPSTSEVTPEVEKQSPKEESSTKEDKTTDAPSTKSKSS